MQRNLLLQFVSDLGKNIANLTGLNRVSIVKTDFGWSEEWLQEVIIVQKASLYIYKNRENIKKNISNK